MSRFVVASTKRSAGKTGLIIGLAAAGGLKAGYIKPLGDRLLYQKKRLWDYDAALVARLWALQEDPENLTIGFEHAKLRFMYKGDAMAARVREAAETMEKGRDVLFIEAGHDLAFGASIGLDAISLSRATGARLLLVAGGTDDAVADDLAFIRERVDLAGADLAGVVISRVQDPADFKQTHLEQIGRLGIPVLGILPFRAELTRMSVGYVADRLLARVITGEKGMGAVVSNVIIGSMTSDASLRDALRRERSLVITSGDRSDVILASLESGVAGVLLTNDIMPPSHIVSKAAERNLPLLLVSQDTYNAARAVDGLETLLMPGDRDKIDLLASDVKAAISFKALKLA